MRQGRKKRPAISAVRREEIIQRIVEILKPEVPINRSAITTALGDKVRDTVARLESSTQYFSREAVRANRDGARQIISTIGTLKNQIRSAPRELHMRMRFIDDAIYFAWLNQLSTSLKPAADNRDISDKVKGHCAQIAFSLMIWCRPILPTNSSAQSPFREIASLLYEMLVGERPAVSTGARKGQKRVWDLQIPCRKVLKDWGGFNVPRHRKVRSGRKRQSVQT
jgi:hypothetical protein